VNSSPSPGNRRTEVIVTDSSSGGGTSKIYYYNSGVWKLVGQGNIDHGYDTIEQNLCFIVRQNVGTTTTATFIGSVLTAKLAIPLTTSTTASVDNYVGLSRPALVSLADSQLFSSGAFAASPLPGSHTDELLTFDNSVAQRNKSASAVYYFWNNAWRRVGAGSADVGSTPIFVPGTGVIIRKATNAVAPVWINSPNYF
jgi:uncharacterized protein (TIGR02597 family)